MLPQLLVLSLVLAPYSVSAALFPKDTLVKFIDEKGFKAAMKQNMTSVVAFVAPWCGHCQKMAPQFSAAALGVHPMVPLYAVDCDAEKNKRLCSQQGVQGFPTIKMYPRGKTMPAVDFNGPERSASAFFYWISRGIPHKCQKYAQLDEVERWVTGNTKKPRALLMNKSNKIPLLWQALANKYRDDFDFGSHRDRKGKSSVKLGFPAGEDGQSKVLIYPAGETRPVHYQGILKYDSLSKFFDSVVDGTADLTIVNEEAAKEEFIPDPEELEIQKKQEAEMLKLAHGGFSDMIDFEQAVKDGSAKNFHAANGYPGMMGGSVPEHYSKDKGDKNKETAKEPVDTAPVSDASSSSSELPKTNARMPVTGEGGKIIAEPTTKAKKKQKATDQPRTGADEPVAASTPVEVPTPEAIIEEEIPVEVVQANEPEVPAEPIVDEPIVEEKVSVPDPEEPVYIQQENAQQVPIGGTSPIPTHEEHLKDEL